MKAHVRAHMRASLQRLRTLGGLALAALCLLLAGCAAPAAAASGYVVPNGDVERGRRALRDYGCGSCHKIDGVPGAVSYVGPPLDGWAVRQYIAGTLPNTPDNLIRWIMHPQAIEPGTAMPDMDVTEQDARDMSAYLYSLEAPE